MRTKHLRTIVAGLALVMTVPASAAHMEPAPADSEQAASCAAFGPLTTNELFLLAVDLSPIDDTDGPANSPASKESPRQPVAAPTSVPAHTNPLPKPGELQPKPPGTDLRIPDQSMLNSPAAHAMLELRQSLTDGQRQALKAAQDRQQAALSGLTKRLPNLPAVAPSLARGAQTSASDTSDHDELSAVTKDLKPVVDQLDKDLNQILTPAQQELLQKALPQNTPSGPAPSVPAPLAPRSHSGASLPGNDALMAGLGMCSSPGDAVQPLLEDSNW